MSSLIERGQLMLARVLPGTGGGVTVTYVRRGRGGGSISIAAVLGSNQPGRTAVQSGTASLEVERLDFLFTPDVIDFGAGPVEPQRGDRITWAGSTYEVTPLDAEPAVKDAGQSAYGYLLQVHTIKVV